METAQPATTISTAISDTGLNPTRLDRAAFLLNFPFSYATDAPNNAWMEEMDPRERTPDKRKAMRQFLEVYHFLAGEALVYLLPGPASCGLQDLVFTANLGIVLDHLPDRNTVVISNFSSPPRVKETDLGVEFFRSLGYRAVIAPHKFEGEAELKHLHDNVYVGGHGIRSEIETYRWMEKQFDMKVVTLEESDPYLYHLDCTVFPVTRENTLVCTEFYTGEELGELEKETNIIDVSADEAYAGICNSVRLGNTILSSSHIHDLAAGTEEYKEEIVKNRKLEDVAARLGFELTFFNLSEFHKSGALLSCMVLHLNRHSYDFTLL